jgi:lysophospholipase L1-like esterase
LRKALVLVLGNAAVLAVLLATIEFAGQAYATLHPAYEGLTMEPDRAIGWKLTPGLAWISTGNSWYARDYSVPVQDNALGFRDRERAETRAQGTLRVAVLGDSFVQAVQVPLEKTATQLLEAKLRAAPPAGFTSAEVLNFGISNHGVGQYLLTWEAYARRFAPERVAIFVGGFHMRRSVAKYEGSLVDPSRPRLWIRPTFSLAGDGSLVREPARDYEKFVAAQREAIEKVFGGERMRRAPRGLFLAPYAQELGRLFGLVSPEEPWKPLPERTLDINLKVVAELGDQLKASGARLAVADASLYFEPRDAAVAQALERLCKDRGLEYIPLSNRLLEANRAGEKTRWAHDGHFNEAGNRIFAEALFDWVKG